MVEVCEGEESSQLMGRKAPRFFDSAFGKWRTLLKPCRKLRNEVLSMEDIDRPSPSQELK